MKLTPNFYRDRVCLNVLAGSKENASEIYEAAEGHVLVGVLSKNYPDVASAVTDEAGARLLGLRPGEDVLVGVDPAARSRLAAELAAAEADWVSAEEALAEVA